MNKYISRLKENLAGYHGVVISQNIYLDDAKKKYTGSYLEQRENEYHAKKKEAFSKFCRNAQNDFEEIKKSISKASFINPETTQSPIFKMFANGNVELTDNEIDVYLNKASRDHDFTTLRAIQSYCNKHKIFRKIPTADEIMQGYYSFYKGAMELANKINDEPQSVSSDYVKAFADEDFSKPLYDTIGSPDFPNQDFSDDFAHAYDDYTIWSPESEIQMSFNPVY